MSRQKGARDLKPRRQRSDMGLKRELFQGHVPFGDFKNRYGKDKDFTERTKMLAKKNSKNRYIKLKKTDPQYLKDMQRKTYLNIKNDKDKWIKYNLRRKLHSAFKRYKQGKKTTSKKYKIDYTLIVESLMNRLPIDFKEKKYEPDHIRPLASFNFINIDGSINYNEIQKAFSPENYQWLTPEENMKKSSMHNGVMIRKNRWEKIKNEC